MEVPALYTSVATGTQSLKTAETPMSFDSGHAEVMTTRTHKSIWPSIGQPTNSTTWLFMPQQSDGNCEETIDKGPSRFNKDM